MRQQRRLGVKSVMPPADVRAMRKAGLNPEEIGKEEGQVSSATYYALLRDRDAIKAHLGWHHEAVKAPDVGTLIEQLRAQVATQSTRITMLEANFTVHEAREIYQATEGG